MIPSVNLIAALSILSAYGVGEVTVGHGWLAWSRHGLKREEDFPDAAHAVLKKFGWRFEQGAWVWGDEPVGDYPSPDRSME